MKLKKYNSFILVLLLVSILSCSNEDTLNNNIVVEPLAYSEQLNVAYGEHERQVYDIYLPENRTLDTKVLILIHGGAWVSGNKETMLPIKEYIRQQLPDVAIVNINYRLAGPDNPPFPMQIDDITAMVNHLEDNSDSYTISNQIGFVGVSAGAQLSMLWSYAYDFENKVKMIGSVVGPTNFTDPAYADSQNPVLLGFIETLGIDPSPEFLESVSPYHQATTTSPPTILFYGGLDPLVPITQGPFMRDKLDELNVTNQFVFYPNGSHGWIGNDLIDTTVKLKAFIELHL